MKIDIGIKKTNMIMLGGNSNIVLAEIVSGEQTREIMNKNKELEKGIIIIEDDLIKKERKIQKKLREIAKGERERDRKERKT